MEQISGNDIQLDAEDAARELLELQALIQKTKKPDYGKRIKALTKKDVIRNDPQTAVRNLQIELRRIQAHRQNLEEANSKIERSVLPALEDLKQRCSDRANVIFLAVGIGGGEEAKDVYENAASDFDFVVYNKLVSLSKKCTKRIATLRSHEQKLEAVLQKLGIVSTWIIGGQREKK